MPQLNLYDFMIDLKGVSRRYLVDVASVLSLRGPGEIDEREVMLDRCLIKVGTVASST